MYRYYNYKIRSHNSLYPTLNIESILNLHSFESKLLCQRKHVAGHPLYCEGGCVLENRDFTVQTVLEYKNADTINFLINNSKLLQSKPISIENNILIDGRHRIAAALCIGIKFLPIVYVEGIAISQEKYHETILEKIENLKNRKLPARAHHCI